MILEKGQLWAKRWINHRWFVPLQFVLAALFLCVGAAAPGCVVLSLELIVLLLLSDDLFAALCPMMAVIMLMTVYYDDYFRMMPYAWLIIPAVLALGVNLILYRKPFVRGKLLFPMAAVSVALLIGGIGVIPKNEYFCGTSFYYMLGLGIVPLVFYILLCARMSIRRAYDVVERIAEIGYSMALFSVLLIAWYYLGHLNEFSSGFKTPFIPYRNFCTTVMLFGLPMPCYFIRKNHWHLLSIPLIYVTMLFGASRSALIFGTVEIIFCFWYIYRTDVTSRKFYRRIGLIILIPLAAVSVGVVYMMFFSPSRRIGVDEFIGANENRVRFYRQGVKDFLVHPLIGCGLANMKNKNIWQGVPGSLNFYHNAVIQAAASLGIVGLAAYGYQFVVRALLIWKNRHGRYALLAVPYMGMLLMSQTNPGIFAPLPMGLLLVLLFASLEFAEEESESEIKAYHTKKVEKTPAIPAKK